MKAYRFFVLPAILFVMVGSLFSYYLRMRQSTPARAQLIRMPGSVAQYDLCSEVFAYVQGTAVLPFKTDYTFHDPFQDVTDTITPMFLGMNQQDQSVTFQVRIDIGHQNMYIETIGHLHENDGIAVLLPDPNNNLQAPRAPQFILTSLGGSGRIAILDYTCPEQWKWQSAPIS